MLCVCVCISGTLKNRAYGSLSVSSLGQYSHQKYLEIIIFLRFKHLNIDNGYHLPWGAAVGTMLSPSPLSYRGRRRHRLKNDPRKRAAASSRLLAHPISYSDHQSACEAWRVLATPLMTSL